jgi:hypothetical protein
VLINVPGKYNRQEGSGTTMTTGILTVPQVGFPVLWKGWVYYSTLTWPGWVDVGWCDPGIGWEIEATQPDSLDSKGLGTSN